MTGIRYLLTFVLLAFCVIVYGQSTKRQYIGLSVGPSFPVSDYAKTIVGDSTSGWAKTGVVINISYAYRLTHNFGIYVTGNFSSNAFDADTYKTELENANPEFNVAVQNERNWSGGGLLVGPYLRFPLFKNFSWDIRGSFGFYSSYAPRLTILAVLKEDTSEQATYYKDGGSGTSYVYSFGTGFKYRLSKYYVLLFADYLNSPQKFKNSSGWDFNNEPYQDTFEQQISSVNATIGLGYIF